MDLTFDVMAKNSLPHPMCFLLKVIVLNFIFISIIHYELIFV